MGKKLLTRKVFGNILIVFLLLCIYTQISTRILFTSVDFDEGYNLLVSYNLKDNFLNYSTFDTKFDTNITTGPALLVPASLFINNTHPLLPRIVMLIFAIIFLFITNKYLFTNQIQKIIFLTCIILTPLFFFFSSHVLGELPGFVFFLSSLIVLSRKKYFWSGALLMLSILTKQVYIFGILAVMLEFLLIHIFSKNQRASISRNTALLISGVLVILLSWYTYILISVNFSFQRFGGVIRDAWTASNTLSQPKLSLIDKRIDMLGYVFGVQGLVFIFLIILICRGVIKKLRQNHIAVSLAFFSICYSLYFLFLGATNWYRHFFPVVLAMLIITPLLIDTILFEKKIKNILMLGGILFLVFISVTSSNIHKNTISENKLIDQNLIFHHEKMWPFTDLDSLLISQIKTAKIVKNLPIDSQVAGISWWNTPEIAYLSGRKIYRDPFQKKTDYIITHYYGRILGSQDYQYLKLIKNKKEVFNSEGYNIYEIEK